MRKTIFILTLFFVQFCSPCGFTLCEIFPKNALAMSNNKESDTNMEDSIIKDAIKIRKTTNEIDIDITYLIDRHIDLNGDQKYIKNYLKTSGFSVSSTQMKNGIISIAGSYDVKELKYPFGNDEIRLVFRFKDEKIVEYKGFMFHHTL